MPQLAAADAAGNAAGCAAVGLNNSNDLDANLLEEVLHHEGTR